MRVLAVDDELGFLRLMEQACEEAGISCIGTTSAMEAMASMHRFGPGYFDLVLLDDGIPDFEGWACSTILRTADPQITVVFLTHADSGHAPGWEPAFEDEGTIAKPMSLNALVEKLHGLRDLHERTRWMAIGRLRLNLLNRTAEFDGQTIELTLQEFRLLLELALARGTALSRTALLERVWRARSDPGTNRVEVHVAHLRRKLKDAGADVIHTVKGEGYVLRVVN